MSVREQIRRLLADVGRPLTARMLAAKLHADPAAIAQGLRDLVAIGEVMLGGLNTYRLGPSPSLAEAELERRVLRLIGASGGLSRGEIARAVGTTTKAAGECLARLRRLRLVIRPFRDKYTLPPGAALSDSMRSDASRGSST